MTFDTDAMIGDCLERLRALDDAWHYASVAENELRQCGSSLTRGNAPTIPVAQFGEVLSYITQDIVAKAHERARQLGWQVATYQIAPMAQGSGSEPVVFITGNSYMPPLREFGASEVVWQLPNDSDGDLFAAYSEAIEARLDELRVYMACPDYDNSLYVVDLARFEHNEDVGDSADSLSDEWKPIT